MLRWRIPLGALFILVVAGLGYLDAHAGRPGAYLAPLAVLLSLLAAGEMLRLFRGIGHANMSTAPIYVATLLPVFAASVPLAWTAYPTEFPVSRLGWLALGLVAGLLVVFLAEMRRFSQPQQSIVRLALGALSVLYVGGLLGMIVQLRLLPGSEAFPGGQRGLVALLTMIAVVKASDIGQYAVGRLVGKHKLAPSLSPGKTWEGALGGVLVAVLVAVVLGRCTTQSQAPLFPLIVAGVLLSVAGILGDLAESLLKRDAQLKDSSDWLPGFGGVLDLVDSLLFAAPVAYVCWASGLLA